MMQAIVNRKAKHVLGFHPEGYATSGHGAELANVPDGYEIVDVQGEHPGAGWKFDWGTDSLVADDDLRAEMVKKLLNDKLAQAYVERAGLLDAKKHGVEVTDRLAEVEAAITDLTAQLDAVK